MRDKFEKRTIRLVGEVQRNIAIALINNLPIDEANPICITVGEQVKARKLDQLALMWSGPLKDIEQQIYLNGRTYSDVVWHHQFKVNFLPEEYDAELCKSPDYRKWDYSPNGDRVLVGSTGDLTVKGFAQHLEQIHAFGASHGVEFHTRER